MYCGVLPIDESDYAFFAAMDVRFTAYTSFFKNEAARGATDKARRALAEIRGALQRNHKHESHRTRKALRTQEGVCMDTLSMLIHE